MSIKSSNKKAIQLSRFVIIEKCSEKDFVLNSEKYLNSIGITLYIWTESNHSIHNLEMIYTPATELKHLNKQIEVYGLTTLVDLYKTITSNSKLYNLPPFKYQINQMGKSAFLRDDDYNNKYASNLLVDKLGHTFAFKIYCMTNKIIKTAGYGEETPF